MECLHNHQQGAEILTEHLAGTLDPAREKELDHHTQNCPDCRRLLEVWDRLDEFQAPALSEDFDHRLYARIANEARMPWWRRILLPAPSAWRPLWKAALPLTAACAVLVLALMVSNPDTDDPVKQVRIEQSTSPSPEIERAVQALDDLELLSPVSATPADAI